MERYKCSLCSFSSNLKSNFKRHLNTKKHQKNHKNHVVGKMKLVENDPKMTPKVTPNDPKMTPNCPKSLTPYFCEHCLVSFTTRAHLMRHLKKNCKEKKKKNYSFFK